MNKLLLLCISFFCFYGCIDKYQNKVPDFVIVECKNSKIIYECDYSIMNNDTAIFIFFLTAENGAKGAIFKIEEVNYIFVDTVYYTDTVNFTDTISYTVYLPINIKITQDTVLYFDVSATSLESNIKYVKSLKLEVKN